MVNNAVKIEILPPSPLLLSQFPPQAKPVLIIKLSLNILNHHKTTRQKQHACPLSQIPLSLSRTFSSVILFFAPPRFSFSLRLSLFTIIHNVFVVVVRRVAVTVFKREATVGPWVAEARTATKRRRPTTVSL